MDPVHHENTARVQPSLVERFGLFTIIMLGEVVVSVITGSDLAHHFSFELLITTALAMGIVVNMWWLYFDYISLRVPIQKTLHRLSWMYVHLPLGVSIAITAGGIYKTLHYQEASVLLYMGLILFFACIAALTFTIQFSFEKSFYCAGAKVSLIGALVLLATMLLAELSAIATLALCLVALVTPILFGFYFWTRQLYTQSQ